MMSVGPRRTLWATWALGAALQMNHLEAWCFRAWLAAIEHQAGVPRSCSTRVCVRRCSQGWASASRCKVPQMALVHPIFTSSALCPLPFLFSLFLAWPFPRHFKYINSFNSPHNPSVTLYRFYRGGHGGRRRISDMSRYMRLRGSHGTAWIC